MWQTEDMYLRVICIYKYQGMYLRAQITRMLEVAEEIIWMALSYRPYDGTPEPPNDNDDIMVDLVANDIILIPCCYATDTTVLGLEQRH